MPVKVVSAASRTLYAAMVAGGAGVSRDPRRSARCGERTDSPMQEAVTDRQQAVAAPIAVVSSVAVGHDPDRRPPATSETRTADPQTSRRTRVLAQNARVAGCGSEDSHTAPDPSRQNALTPSNNPAPAATRPGRRTSDAQSSPTAAATTPGSRAST